MIAGMRAGAAPDRYRAGQARFGQPDQVGGVDFAADQDEVPRRWRGGAGPAQVLDNGRGHLADVARALRQVGVGQGGEQGGLGLRGRFDRGRAAGSARTASIAGPIRAGSAAISAAISTMPAWRSSPRRAEPPGEGGPVPRDRGERRPHVVLGRVMPARGRPFASARRARRRGRSPRSRSLRIPAAPGSGWLRSSPGPRGAREGAEDEGGGDGAGVLVADAARPEVARAALQRLHGDSRHRAGRGRLGERREGVSPATPPRRPPC